MKKKRTGAVHDNETELDDETEAPEEGEEPSEMLLDVENGAVAPTEDSAPDEEDENAVLAQALDEARDQLLRMRAEFDNYRKRVARDAERLRKMAAEGLLKDLLPVADNFERALQHGQSDPASLVEGIAMVYKQFVDVLARHGVEPISATGQPFDPNVHDALSRMPSEEHSEDTVSLEYEKGYRLGDIVLRPAKVVVSSGPAEE